MFVQQPANAYSARKHMTIEKASSSLVSTRGLSTASVQPHSSRVSSQIEPSMSSKEVRTELLDKIKLLRARTLKTTSLALQWYKTNFGKNSKRGPVFVKGELVYVDTSKTTIRAKQIASDRKRAIRNRIC